MPATISGVLGSVSAGGMLVPLASATMIVYPSSNTYACQVGGAGAFIPLAYNANDPLLRDPYRFGFAAQTDAMGNYSFPIPLVSETHTPIPGQPVTWSILLPDGRQYTGAPTASASLDALVQTYGWLLTKGQQVYAPMQGTIARGRVAVSGAQTSVPVNFTGGNMPSSTYEVLIRAGKDSTTNAVPDFDVPLSGQSVSGFTVTFDPGFTGSFDYVAWGG